MVGLDAGTTLVRIHLTKGADPMNTIMNIDWAAVLGVLGGLGVVAFMLLLIARLQIRQRDA